MNKRSIPAVVLLTLFTFGIYSLVWHVKTKNEMNRAGTQIPTAWLLLVPIANFYWLWKWSDGAARFTGGTLSRGVVFILIMLLGIVGMGVVQNAVNKELDRVAPAQLPQAWIAA